MANEYYCWVPIYKIITKPSRLTPYEQINLLPQLPDRPRTNKSIFIVILDEILLILQLVNSSGRSWMLWVPKPQLAWGLITLESDGLSKGLLTFWARISSRRLVDAQGVQRKISGQSGTQHSTLNALNSAMRNLEFSVFHYVVPAMLVINGLMPIYQLNMC